MSNEQQRKQRSRYNLAESNKRSRPRLSVHRTARHIYAQVIDDAKGATLAAYSTKAKGWQGSSWNTAAAEKVGAEVGKIALAAGIKDVVFDRGSYRYHGRVKALADAARKAGLNF
ncbi:MAG: 50S ribosomal protein L18 [Rickettsiales bacterium]|jgi:large subunit ribosomal protein L18|nr:50S ribosomal protein L18 [Rickettsiales bacterium]